MEITIGETQSQVSQQLSLVSSTSSLDAQVLLAHYLAQSRSWILAHPDAQLDHDQLHNLQDAVDRMVNGEPLPYILGHWEFYGIDYEVSPAVLIPRPETELLVDRAIEWLRLHPRMRNAVDVGTGTGCIGISLARHISDLHITLTDISPEALKVARKNVEKQAVQDRTGFMQSDLLDQLPADLNFDLICANLPYIPTVVLMTLPVAKSEPLIALDGGPDGTRLINSLLEKSQQHLNQRGLILLEIEASQGNQVVNLAEFYFPGSEIKIHKDLSGKDRCVEVERSNFIVHLCQRDEWNTASHLGSYRDRSLEQVGFIHCSKPEQIRTVANRFYRGLPDLVLMWLDPDKLVPEIRWQWADGELFPHVFGPINLDAVVSITQLNPDHDGFFSQIPSPH